MSQISPGTRARAITPGTSPLVIEGTAGRTGTHMRQLYVGGAGNVVGTLAGDAADATSDAVDPSTLRRTFVVSAGQTLDYCFLYIYATSTTATGLVGIY